MKTEQATVFAIEEIIEFNFEFLRENMISGFPTNVCTQETKAKFEYLHHLMETFPLNEKQFNAHIDFWLCHCSDAWYEKKGCPRINVIVEIQDDKGNVSRKWLCCEDGDITN